MVLILLTIQFFKVFIFYYYFLKWYLTGYKKRNLHLNRKNFSIVAGKWISITISAYLRFLFKKNTSNPKNPIRIYIYLLIYEKMLLLFSLFVLL